MAPGPLEDVRQDQHGHVAAHAVALAGDLQQLADHRLLRGRVAVVELQRVGPAGEIRVAAVGQQQVAALAFDPGVILRRPGQVEFRAADEVLGMVLDPGMVRAPCGWGRSRASARRPRWRSRSRSRASAASPPRSAMHRVAGDGEAGAGDVLLAQVGQRLLEFLAPLRIAARDPLARRAGLPDAEEPDPVEAHLGQPVQLGVGNVVQRRRPAQLRATVPSARRGC